MTVDWEEAGEEERERERVVNNIDESLGINKMPYGVC